MKKTLLAVTGTFFLCTVSYATHSWGGYHWARTSSPFDLPLVNSTTNDWDNYVSVAVSDWSQSKMLNMAEDTNGSTDSKVRRRCKGDNGMVRICNLAYGQNGWLGIAGISIDSNGHITTAYVKLNDTYFAWDYYNNDLWKQAVTCQELGHTLGLDHQDEDFNNDPLYTCMDYQDPPTPYPNAHDYEELEIIYAHLDSYDSYATGGSSGGGGTCNATPGKGCNKAGPSGNQSNADWGQSMGRHGQQETFLRIDPDGTRHVTFVTWARGH